MNEREASKPNISRSMRVRKHRKETSAKLLFEAHNLGSDPNLSRDNAGRYMCVLCKTKHLTELSYVRHREGKKHNKRLSKRTDGQCGVEVPQCYVRNILLGDKRGYAVTIDYKLAAEMPAYRFVSSLEQNVESLDEGFRYLVFVCKPYRNIGIKFENRDVDGESVYEDIDEETGIYTFHFSVNNGITMNL